MASNIKNTNFHFQWRLVINAASPNKHQNGGVLAPLDRPLKVQTFDKSSLFTQKLSLSPSSLLPLHWCLGMSQLLTFYFASSFSCVLLLISLSLSLSPLIFVFARWLFGNYAHQLFVQMRSETPLRFFNRILREMIGLGRVPVKPILIQENWFWNSVIGCVKNSSWKSHKRFILSQVFFTSSKQLLWPSKLLIYMEMMV